MAKVDGTQAVSGAWYATDAVMSFGALRASMYGGNEDYTVGKALYAAMKQGDANGFYESWSGTEQLAAAAVELFGDETFTKSGSGYKWHFGKEELAMLLAEAIPGFIADSGVEELSIDLTLRSDGGVELKYTASTSVNEEAALRIDYTFAGNSSRMTAKGTVQVRNVCDVTFDAAVSVRTTSEKPLAARQNLVQAVDFGIVALADEAALTHGKRRLVDERVADALRHVGERVELVV